MTSQGSDIIFINVILKQRVGFVMDLKRIIAVLLIFSIILTGCIGTNVKAAQEDSNAIEQEVNKENEKFQKSILNIMITYRFQMLRQF